MGLSAFKMRFTSPLHLGAEGAGVEKVEQVLHSDTLFSAICNGWVEVYGADSLNKLLDRFPKQDQNTIPTELPFRISSAFPFVETENSEVTYFLPKLKKHPPTPRFDKSDFPKPEQVTKLEGLLDDVTWLDMSFFLTWASISSQPATKEDLETNAWEDLLKQVNEAQERLKQGVLLETRPRVTLDRVSSTSQLYFFGALRFERAGLYCLVKCRDEETEKQLNAVLGYLGEEAGIGGERNNGYGRFKTKWADDFDFPLLERFQTPPTGRSTLSLYYPAPYDDDPATRDFPLVQYALLPRAGWVESPSHRRPVRRQVVNMIEEGTIFDAVRNVALFTSDPKVPAETLGCLVEVAPKDFKGDHPIYRYGIAFTLPVIL